MSIFSKYSIEFFCLKKSTTLSETKKRIDKLVGQNESLKQVYVYPLVEN
jgi:hypothetical protein